MVGEDVGVVLRRALEQREVHEREAKRFLWLMMRSRRYRKEEVQQVSCAHDDGATADGDERSWHWDGGVVFWGSGRLCQC